MEQPALNPGKLYTINHEDNYVVLVNYDATKFIQTIPGGEVVMFVKTVSENLSFSKLFPFVVLYKSCYGRAHHRAKFSSR